MKQKECSPNCDYENPVHKSRATWCCPNCGRDYSIEYLFLYLESEREKEIAKEKKGKKCKA